MASAGETALQRVQRDLSSAPESQPQLRAVLAYTIARWSLTDADEAAASRHFQLALEAVPDLRPAMRALYRIYARRNDVRNAVLYLDQEIRATRHPREAAALYRERGQLVEAYFRDLVAARQCYEAALRATPKDLAVLRSVEHICLARGDVFGLIENLEAQLDVLKDEGAITGLLHDLALIETRHGGDLALAADLLLAALEAAPGHLGLIGDLFRVAEVAGDGESMLIALEAEVDARAGAERAAPLARASLLLRERRDRNSAVLLLESAARAQPDNISLWRNLEELSMATSHYETAVRACVGQLRAIGNAEPAARAELFYRIGRLAMVRLDRVNEGLAAMRKCLRLFPGHIPALEDAARHLIDHGLWSQLLELLKLQISTAAAAGLSASETAQTYLRTGQLLEERIGDPENARRMYAEAARIAPHYRPTRDRLERVLHQLGDREGLREHYAAELDSAPAGPRRRFLLSVLGQLHVGDADPERAIRYLVALLKIVPEHLPSLQRLARLLALAGRTKELLKVTEQEIKLTLSPTRAAKLRHRAGELALSLDDPERAIAHFRGALELIDDHQASIANLEALARARGDHDELLRLLRKRLLYDTDRGRQVALRLEIATSLAQHFGQAAEGLAELQQLLERWPKHLPALHAAEGLAARLGRWEELTELLDRHIATVQGPRTRALLLHRVANVRSRRLGDDEGAIRDLVRALELWPQLGVARALLLRLYERLGHSRKLQAFAEAGLTTERGADDRRAMALQLAELTPKPVVAIQYLAAVVEARPDDFVTQLRLARASSAARRPSRAAGALVAAAEVFAEELARDHPFLLALRYRAARAEESAGNLDAADELHARILDVDPAHELARRGRLRVKEEKRAREQADRSDDFSRASHSTSAMVEQAAYATIAAEIHERRGDLASAVTRVREALVARPDYVPALHCKARVLERLGSRDQIDEAMATLEQLARALRVRDHKVRALCRAASLALRTSSRTEHNEQAWRLFSAALELDPSSDAAFLGLERTADLHGSVGAPPLHELLRRRAAALAERQALGASELRGIARIVGVTDGPSAAVALIEEHLECARDDPGVHADLAQGYAKLARWPEVVRELDISLATEISPERAAALHYFAADALERAERPLDAVPHYLEAARGGFHPMHALLAAERIAAASGILELRVQALQLLVELGDGAQRVRSLRALADLHRGPLGKPDLAIELFREILLLSPTDLDVIGELRRLLIKLERGDEALAAVLAGIAQHRAWLRSQGVRSEEGRAKVDLGPIRGLRELFDLLDDPDGVYLSSAILEVFAPHEVSRSAGERRLRSCDEQMGEPWSLPAPQDGRPLDALVGDLPGAAALYLLQEANSLMARLPPLETSGTSLDPRRQLPDSTGVVLVTKALAGALGIPRPLVFVDADSPVPVRAVSRPHPAIVVDRRVNSTPFAPRSRDLIGRALFRLVSGGDAIHRDASVERILAFLAGACAAADVIVPGVADWRLDSEFHDAVRLALGDASASSELRGAAMRFAAMTGTFDPRRIKHTMVMGEDRAGVVCAADPRPTLESLLEEGAVALTSPRGSTLLGYLLSDDHLGLRRTLGYRVALELDEVDLEEVPT